MLLLILATFVPEILVRPMPVDLMLRPPAEKSVSEREHVPGPVPFVLQSTSHPEKTTLAVPLTAAGCVITKCVPSVMLSTPVGLSGNSLVAHCIPM
ncbi:MAG: hypothetical protein BGO51_15600 [Rhodospirillales bacterium 69-11]|nr:MAG: hypothetical protein BGO51_15600 [Rhodospirillales bacterium 69-11]